MEKFEVLKMKAQTQIIKTGNTYEWHILIEKPFERYMGTAVTKQEAYTRMNEVIKALKIVCIYEEK